MTMPHAPRRRRTSRWILGLLVCSVLLAGIPGEAGTPPPAARTQGGSSRSVDRPPLALLVVGVRGDPGARAREEALVRRLQGFRSEQGLAPAALPILTYHVDIEAERRYCEGRLGVRRGDTLFAGLALLAADRLPSEVVEGRARVADVAATADELGVMAVARTRSSEGEIGEATDPTRAYAEHSARGDEAFRRQDYEQALQHYAVAARSRPDEWRGVYRQGLALAALRRYGEAETIALAATALAPEHPLPRTLLAVSLAAQSRYDEAQVEFRKAIALAPGWAMPHGSLADFALGRKIWDVARTEALEAARLDSRLASPHFVLGILAMRAWRLAEACEQLEEALRLRPDWGLACDMLAWSQVMRGDFTAAWKAFDREAGLAPASPAPLTGQAMIRYYEDRPAEALDWFAKARRMAPRSSTVPALEAFALAAQGRADEALRAAREALAGSPGDPNAREGLGHALAASGRFREACEAYAEAERMLDGWPEPELLYRWALAADASGDRGAAVGHLRRLLGRYPGSIFETRTRALLGRWNARP